jgi:hypothetical protein
MTSLRTMFRDIDETDTKELEILSKKAAVTLSVLERRMPVILKLAERLEAGEDLGEVPTNFFGLESDIGLQEPAVHFRDANHDARSIVSVDSLSSE